ncbi:UDP-glucuronosyl/UDP-glucosyltransferase [Trema orientale]|uniref:UDP-glucuronosyl/UDP-glucosyltransferase n=1 Tax=Trema orientale TaxID=63057 RepID=A0A2P5E5X6_TREOI|nr:UDP-glucuronosyl/UDP-glucosyltransferase [Trema orientale]
MPDGVSDPHIHSKNFVSVISGFNIICKPTLQAALAQMMGREDHHEKIAYIIYDEYMYFSEEVANHLRLPSIILSTSSATNMLT